MTLSVVVTEDTPADMLTGQMSITVLLPSGKPVRMNVNRSTPMMDLLVQVTTANKLSPAGHLLQPYGDGGQLPYKPSTPIGALDTWTVQVVPKLGSSQNSSSTKSGSRISAQPFEQTFRLQVHLPRNQLYVMRVSAKTVLGEILKQVCQEKCLDPNKYSLRHPRQLGQALDERLTIADYRHNQICIVSNRSVPTTVSTDDILAMHHQYTSSIRSGGSSSRSLSPDSSISPQPASVPNLLLQHQHQHEHNGGGEGAPMRHNRKRRPAPKPPVPQQNIPQQQQNNKKDRGVAHDDGGRTVICHSRTSSDSSGYHEASVLSESPDSNNSLADSLPRHSRLPGNKENNRSNGRNTAVTAISTDGNCKRTVAPPLQKQQPLSRSLINISTTTAVINNGKPQPPPPGRKKKPAPAPPIFRSTVQPPSLISGTPPSSKTLPPGVKLLEPSSPPSPTRVVELQKSSSAASSASSTLVATSTPYSTKDEEPTMADEEIDRIFKDATRDDELGSLDSDNDVADKEAVMTQPSLPCTPPPPAADCSGVLDRANTDELDRIPDVKPVPLRERIVVKAQVEKPPVSQSPPVQEIPEIEEERVCVLKEVTQASQDNVSKNPEEHQELPIYQRQMDKQKQLSQVSVKCEEREKHAMEVLNELSNRINECKNKQQTNEEEGEIPSLTKNRRGSEPAVIATTNCQLDNFKITTYDSSAKRTTLTSQVPKIRNDTNSAPDEGQTNGADDAKQAPEKKLCSNVEIKRAISVEAPERTKLTTITTTTNKSGSNAAIDGDNTDHVPRKWDSPVASVKRSVSLAFHVGRQQEQRAPLHTHQNSQVDQPTAVRDYAPEFTSLEERRRMLRKTTSELSIADPGINDNIKKREQFEHSITGLQSLKVLKSILPHLSQSHGSVDKLGASITSVTSDSVTSNVESPKVSVKSKVAAFNRSTTDISRTSCENISNSSNNNERNNSKRSENVWQKPKVTMTTWGEREKREVSIKWDRDYYVEQNQQPQQQDKPQQDNNSRVKEAEERRVVIVEEKLKEPPPPVRNLWEERRPQQVTKQQQQRTSNGQSVYKTIETGNTRPIVRHHLHHPKQQEQHHLRQRCSSQDANPPPPPPPTVVQVIAATTRPPPSVTNNLVSRIQIRCDGLSRPALATSRVVGSSPQDTRGQLLSQIRSFGGRANLKKLSA